MVFYHQIKGTTSTINYIYKHDFFFVEGGILVLALASLVLALPASKNHVQVLKLNKLNPP